MRRADRGQCIHDIVFAEQAPLDRGGRSARKIHRESSGRRAFRDVRTPIEARVVETESLARRPAAHLQGGGELAVLAVYEETSGARHGAQQLIELAPDRRHVRINIRVIVLQIVENRGARTVVYELGALVEK